MKPPNQSRLSSPGDERQVRQFLMTHPDFFARNPELVERLLVPHACGPAESLIERQVALLRTKNRELERQLTQLIANARDNEALHERIHLLGLRLLECSEPNVLFDILYHSICRDFRADAVGIRVVVDANVVATMNGGERVEFIADDDEETVCSFGSLLELSQAECGPLRADARTALFGWSGDGPGSGVLVPMSVQGRPGVFGLASRDTQRFHSDMGTTFLQQLGGMLGMALGRLVDSAARH